MSKQIPDVNMFEHCLEVLGGKSVDWERGTFWGRMLG